MTIPKPHDIVEVIKELILQWEHGLITSAELANRLILESANLGFSSEINKTEWEIEVERLSGKEE